MDAVSEKLDGDRNGESVPEPVEDVPIKLEKPKDTLPDDDALTKKLEKIRERRKRKTANIYRWQPSID